MSDKKETLGQTIITALVLCIVCSIVVSASVVLLKPTQTANKAFERKKNVVTAAGLYEPAMSKTEVEDIFEAFEAKIVDLETGQYLTESELSSLNIDPAKFDQKKAAKTAGLSVELSGAEDIANIKRRSKYALVYIKRANGKIERMVLPVHGYGLWSVLYGFLAVGGSGNDVLGLTFYAHAETPGLGGEVDNPSWKAMWEGKKIFNESGEVGLGVIKGQAPAGSDYEIDGLSGATLTSRGVDNLIKYWMGNGGFGAYLANVQKGEI